MEIKTYDKQASMVGLMLECTPRNGSCRDIRMTSELHNASGPRSAGKPYMTSGLRHRGTGTPHMAREFHMTGTAHTTAAAPRLFVDMDGTLAEYRKVDDLQNLYHKGYFSTLAPNREVCAAVEKLVRQQAGADIEVFILSAYLTDSPYALLEKNAWLDEHLGRTLIDSEHRLFVPCGEPKTAYVPGGLRPTDVLFDDYSKNLFEWEEAGACGLKALNGINSTRGMWQNGRVSIQRQGDELARIIYAVAHGWMTPSDTRVSEQLPISA